MGNNPRRAVTARACKALYRAVERSVVIARHEFSTSNVVESLESRQLLSATVTDNRRLSDKLDSSLDALYQNYLLPPSTTLSSLGQSTADSLVQETNGAVEVASFANPGAHNQLVAALKWLKATKIIGKGREVDAMVPVKSLGTLAHVKSLRFSEAADIELNAGVVTSQGDIADQAAGARTAFGINGSGVKVGIISDSFNTSAAATDKYANDVASGDLPSNVQILNDGLSTDTDEGRAMAQVIYDSAPGATLAFDTAGQTLATFAAAITALVNDGCKVIVDDISSIKDPAFQDGVVAQAVTSATASGVTYITAAGNSGLTSFSGSWRAGPAVTAGQYPVASGALNAPPLYAGTTFNFNSTGTSNMDSFQLPGKSTAKFSVQWDAPYYSISNTSGGATNQVDAYILNAAGTQIVAGSAAGTVGADPIQSFTITNSTATPVAYNLMIVYESGGATPTVIKVVETTGVTTNWAFTSPGSIYGHANAVGANAIGAVSYAKTPAFGVSPPVLESYSGTGGTQILFNSTGGRLTAPLSRQEPMFVAPDQVLNTFYGTVQAGNTYPTFAGTSAAAASAAGVAALVISKTPAITTAQVITALQNTSIGLTTTTPNPQSGYGLIQATSAISTTVVNITGTVFFDSNGSGALDTGESGIATQTVFIDLNNNGILDAGEPVTATASNGTYAFYNQTAGTVTVRVVPPAGYVTTQPPTSLSKLQTPPGYQVTIVQGATKANINLGLFPDVFTNTNSGISYTLRTNASIAADVDIVTVSTTYTVPLSILPSLTFNLTGGSDTVNVNYSAGSPIPVGGLLYTAGGSNNSLIMTGSTGIDNFSVYNTVTYYNTSAGVVSTVTANNVQSEIINGVAGNDIFSVETAQPVNESLAFNGGTGVVNDTLTIDDVLPKNGTTTFFNPGTNAGDANTLNLNVGKFTFSQNPAATASNLTVNVQNSPNGMNVSSGLIFAAGALGSGINVRTLAALNISTGSFNVDPDHQNAQAPSPDAIVAVPASHADRAVLVVGKLSVTGIGQLDLNTNDMIVTNSSIGAVNPMLANGFAGGTWNGTGGIISSAAAGDTTHLTALGVLVNNNGGSPFYGTGTALGTFDGQSPATSAILVKYTYYGDADLNGRVDTSDYSRVDNGFIQALTGWANGDFNYDGIVNGSDYTLLDNTFNTQGPTLG